MAANAVASALREMMAAEAIPPFVYCYPPRSAYVAEEAPSDVEQVWREDLEISGPDLNLYLHVPFCRYRCGFCNLYTVTGARADDYATYASALASDVRAHADIIQRRKLRTIYIGGGTPTLLAIEELSRVFAAVDDVYPGWRSVVEEVAIEASPDSLSGPGGRQYLRDLRAFGLTRVNLGVQSLQPSELREAGRAVSGRSRIEAAISNVRDAGIPNLSTDLIIGFHGQTDDSWLASVEALLALRPETISTYFLTVRPDAGFGRTARYPVHRLPHLYRRYERAREAILAAGYVQESNVRYKIPGVGGYRQKVLQFRGVPVLGLGAGARSYTNSTDYLVGGSHLPRLAQINDYMAGVRDGAPPVTAGFRFDPAERVRKRVVLDLFDLHLGELTRLAAPWVLRELEPLFEAAEAEGLLRQAGHQHYQLTERGYQYRDILSWMAFSEEVRKRDASFYSRIASVTAGGSRPPMGRGGGAASAIPAEPVAAL